MANKRKPVGRPPTSIEEAREFLRLLDIERERLPDAKQEEVHFANIRKLDPERWGQIRKMYRLIHAGTADREQRLARVAAALKKAGARITAAAAAERVREALARAQRVGDGPTTRVRRLDTGRQGLD